MLYRILDDLPKLPDNLKKLAWDSVDSQSAVINWYVLGNTHGRTLYKDSKTHGRSSGLPRREMPEEFNKWISENITDLFIDVGLCVSEVGLDHSGPHRDQSRNFSLVYVLRQGSENATTTYWKPKPGIEVLNHYSNYDELEFLDQINIPLETWCLLDGKTIHSVENIQEGRVTIQVSINTNPWA